MKYDNAAWHVRDDDHGTGDYHAGATHAAIFLAWAASRNLLSEIHIQDSQAGLKQLMSRRITPLEWFMAHCDGKFTDEDLTEEGNQFAQSYYTSTDEQDADRASYTLDYVDMFTEVDSICEVRDTWENYDRIAPLIDRHYTAWKKATGRVPSGFLAALGLKWLKPKR